MLFNDNSIILGLTGMSGAGKTTACKAFRDYGFSVVDCDIVARQIVEIGKPALKELSENFDNVILPDGNLNRRKIADIIFSEKDKLKLFNDIVYPYILYKVISDAADYINGGKRLILIDAPTLFESGADRICDIIISVVADKEKCIDRIKERDKLTYEQAANRLSAQHDKKYYIEKSDFYIDNCDGYDEFSIKAHELSASIGEMYGER